jgi:hypothetical protein
MDLWTIIAQSNKNQGFILFVTRHPDSMNKILAQFQAN